METRLFSENDRGDLQRIYLESRRRTFDWLDTTSFAEADFDRDTVGETVWVAIREDVPVGFVSVWRPEHFIHHLFVDPLTIGQGIGTALLKESLAHIGRPAALKCAARNIHALRFYLARGWRVASKGNGPDGDYVLMHFGD